MASWRKEARLLLAQYQAKSSLLTEAKVQSLLAEVKEVKLTDELSKVLAYMVAVEQLTELYYASLRLTVSFCFSFIRAFMKTWLEDELWHARILGLGLKKAGAELQKEWFEEVKAKISWWSWILDYAIVPLASFFLGRTFVAIHMSVGRINERTTLGGYKRLAQLLSNSPGLQAVIIAIAQDEARHYFFYGKIAKLAIGKSRFRKWLVRMVVLHVWLPVGAGFMSKEEAEKVLAFLFGNEVGKQEFNDLVAEPLQKDWEVLAGLDLYQLVYNKLDA
jgi:hypothetical protein